MEMKDASLLLSQSSPRKVSSSSSNGSLHQQPSPLTSPDKENLTNPSMRPKMKAPPGTVEYQVQGSETLESISIKCNATPSELVKLNKLALRMVFPGQKIFIPDPNHKPQTPPDFAKSVVEKSVSVGPTVPQRRPSPAAVAHAHSHSLSFPGHIEAVVVDEHDEEKRRKTENSSPKRNSTEIVSGSATQPGEEVGQKLDEECHARFLKINAASVIEDAGQSVSGVLLVTPNAIMFDPNVSDTLVLQHGTDKYGTIIPMENILSAAIYSEIVPSNIRRSSRVEPIPFGALSATTAERRESSDTAAKIEEEIDHSSGLNVTDKAPLEPVLGSGFTFSPPDVARALADNSANGDIKEEKDHHTNNANLLSPDPVKPTSSRATSPRPRRPTSPYRTRSSSKNSSDEMGGDDPPSRKVSLAPLRKLSRTLMGRESSKSRTTSDSDDWPALNIISGKEIQDGFLQRAGSLRGTVSQKTKSLVDYSSNLFQTTDENEHPALAEKSSSEEVSSPLPGESFTSWQLRRGLSREDVLQAASVRRQKFGYTSVVTMEDKPSLFKSIEDLLPQSTSNAGKPLYLCFRVGTPVDPRCRPISAPVEAYGRKKLKPEYWFAIERDKADKFYGFLLHWRPEVYGTENMDPADLGFMLFDEPDEQMNEHFAKDLRGMAKEWEVIAFDEARRRAFFLEREESVMLPELRGESEILNEEICRGLVPHLPARAQGYPWNLVYNTCQHGFSLKTLYRRMLAIDSPTLFIIKDVCGHVFGAVISAGFKVCEHFYGTGESLLFTFCPKFKVYNWNGVNDYIVRCQAENIAIGSGGGSFGLWLDEDFYKGRTQSCTTFDNEPLCTCSDFTVKAVEAWCFY